VILRVLDHLRRPDHAAAGIVAAEDRHDHPVIGADVLESAEDAGGDVEDVAFFKHHLARRAPAAPEEAPAALEHEEDFGRAVGVQRVAAFGRLAGRADVEADGVGDVDVLVGAFRDAAADDREVLLLVRARRMGVDEGGLAGLEFAVADDRRSERSSGSASCLTSDR
jgi:hypothetical protein